MEQTSIIHHTTLPPSPNTKPLSNIHLIGIGGVGLVLEQLMGFSTFGLLTTTTLIGTIVHQRVGTLLFENNSSVRQSTLILRWSLLGLVATGLSAFLSDALTLDILKGTEERDTTFWLPMFTWFISIGAVLGSLLFRGKEGSFNWLKIGASSVGHAIQSPLIALVDAQQSRLSKINIPIKSLFINGIVPLVSILFFSIIYSGINPEFESSTSFIFDTLSWTVEQWGYLVTHLPYGQIGLGSLILWVVISSFTKDLENVDGKAMNPELDRVLDSLGQSDEVIEDADNDTITWSIETLTPTLVVLNALLLWFHIIDLGSIVGSDFNDPVLLSENVHACLTRVVFATVSAIAILLLPSSASNDAGHLRVAKAWVVNNGIFALWAIAKVGLYIGLCGLTVKRIAILGVFVGLGWTVRSCFQMLTKGTGALWIVNRAIEHQYVTMIVSSIFVTLVGLIRFF